MGVGRAPGWRVARSGDGRGDHRPVRPHKLAAGRAGDRPPRAAAPRHAVVVHRSRRPPLPSDPNRPLRVTVSRSNGCCTAPARTLRTGSAARNKPGLRTSRSARLRPQRSVARGLDDRQGPDRLDQHLALDDELAICEPKSCAIGCSTPPPATPSTLAARRYDCNAPGRGPERSPPRSRVSPRYHQPAADATPTPPSPTPDQSTLGLPAAIAPARDTPNDSADPAETPVGSRPNHRRLTSPNNTPKRPIAGTHTLLLHDPRLKGK